MQFFENEIITKKLKHNQILKYIGLTILVIAIVSGIGFYLFSKNDDGKPLNDFLLANQLEENQKTYINIIHEPIYIGNYTKENKIYFLVKDENYSYVAKISQENYYKYQNATLENPIMMKGITKQISDPLMMAIINAINKDAEEKDYVDIDWFVEFLGLLYLDEGEEVKELSAPMMILIGIGILGLGMYLVSIIIRFRYEKNIAYMSIKEIKNLDKELNEKNARYYPELQTFITKNYLVSLKKVLTSIPLEELVWIYPIEISLGEENKKKALKVFTSSFEENEVALTNLDNKEFDKLYNDLKKKITKALIGYTKANEKKYLAMQKDTKN